VAVARGSYLGPLPPDALSRHYLAQLGRVPRTVFLWPVEVQRRLVVVLYGDCGPRPVSQRRLADFILFCQDLPAAFHELMLFRRQDPHSWGALVERQAAAARPGPPPVVPGAQGQGEWFDGLLSLLTGPEPDQRTAAMQELLRTPAASARALSDAFPGPSAWTRLPVVEVPDPDELGPLPGALARLGDEGARALAPLLDAQDSDTRYLALLTAGSVPSPDVVGGVLRGLFDLEPDISSAARAAAAALKHLPALQGRLPELRRELVASDPLRRSLAARALGVLHDRPSIEGLINLSASEDGLCAQAAADALKELTRLDLGPHPTAWARWWARARDLRRVDWLAAALESQDFDLRLAAIEELSRAFQDNLGYFADSPDDERAPAAARWRQALAARPDLDL
jgi:HEAT repeat protein